MKNIQHGYLFFRGRYPKLERGISFLFSLVEYLYSSVTYVKLLLYSISGPRWALVDHERPFQNDVVIAKEKDGNYYVDGKRLNEKGERITTIKIEFKNIYCRLKSYFPKFSRDS